MIIGMCRVRLAKSVRGALCGDARMQNEIRVYIGPFISGIKCFEVMEKIFEWCVFCDIFHVYIDHEYDDDTLFFLRSGLVTIKTNKTASVFRPNVIVRQIAEIIKRIKQININQLYWAFLEVIKNWL